MRTSELDGPLNKRQFSGTISSLQLIMLLAAVDQTIIATAMPRIVAELGGFDNYAWATTSYLLTSTVAVPVSGKLSDSFGRRRLLLLGVAVFVIASLLCGAAGLLYSQSGMLQLILARALQGTGGGIMLALIFAVVADMLPPAERGRYQGHFAATFALASIVGPVLGGWVSESMNWRWLFFVNAPIGLLAMFVFARSFPGIQRQTTSQQKVDYAGIFTFIVTLTALLLGLSGLSDGNGIKANVLMPLATAAITGLAFIKIETNTENALMPIPLFTRPIVYLSSIALFVTGVGMFGSVLLIPLYFQMVLGLSAANSGLLLTPLILTVALTSMAGGFLLSSTKRYKSLVIISLTLITIGVLCLCRIDQSTPVPIVLSLMMLAGAGMGLLLPVYPIIIQNAVPQDEVGTVTGFSQFFRSIGGTVGVALLGALMLHFYRAELFTLLPTTTPEDVRALLASPVDTVKLKAKLLTLTPIQDVSQLISCVRAAMVAAVRHIFVLYTAAAAITTIISLWLEEKPLREANESVAHSETV